MKKIFLIFSSAVVMLLLTFSLIQNKDIIAFQNYAGIDVLGQEANKAPIHRDKFNLEMNKFTKENNIVLAQRIVEPNKAGKTEFKYAIFGEGNLPKGLEKASTNTLKFSDITGSYLVVKGQVDPNILKSKFADLGYTAFPAVKTPLIRSLQMLLNATSVLCIFIFLLTFAGLSLIYRIKDLRFAGIRLISGESLAAVTLRPVKSDLTAIGIINLITWFIGLCILLFKKAFYLRTITVLSIGILIYIFVLLCISLILSIVYLFSLKKSTLMSLIKGKLPLKKIISIMLIAQFLSILTVGFTVKQFTGFYSIYQEMNLAKDKWQKASDRFIPNYSMTASATNRKEDDRRNKIEYNLVKDSIENHDALLCQNNLDRYLGQKELDGVKATDYLPEGNTIYVTPNYLSEQNVEISSKLKKRLQNLKPGEFGLLLPEKLKTQESKITKRFINLFNLDLKDTKFSNTSYSAIKGYLSNNQQRFLYNGSSLSNTETQFLKDPIIVVRTPTSTRSTPATNSYWSAALSKEISFKGYDSTIKILKDHKAYQWFSVVTNGNLNYLNSVNKFRTQLISLLIGSLMSVVTSIFMFAMNLLYFEEFRKEIFIKRLSGMTFTEIHFNYLLAQLTVLLVAAIGGFLLTKDLIIIVGTTILFIAMGSMMIYRQIKTEDTVAVTVMKGK
ncbi:bacteriocin-associated integral membrane family protein [Xylocopilactobacillus apicola]|uniref:Bacteriocin-associated integral membrane protein n=1 Tax=Xylocopilactobacillus apicola TaxID=2932184 RepID=A0AAU9DUJ1_9LACO|nr:DUF1430 domain-containing protein [Xylocopilactobacillus apicola]BDR59153.1 hypothetical protein XA3_15940 [Xylocopilactobacillus apicola]